MKNKLNKIEITQKYEIKMKSPTFFELIMRS